MLEAEELTWHIRRCVFEVYKKLGNGFLESVYERALFVELESQGLPARRQATMPVFYRGCLVGQFNADLIVDDRVVLELKAQRRLAPGSEAQLINYLRASGLRVGLLINFTYPRATIARFVV